MCSTSVGLLMRLYNACSPSTASYGCEVWGMRDLPGDTRRGRDALGTWNLSILKALAGVPTCCVYCNVALGAGLGQCPISMLGSSPGIRWQGFLILVFTSKLPLIAAGTPLLAM